MRICIFRTKRGILLISFIKFIHYKMFLSAHSALRRVLQLFSNLRKLYNSSCKETPIGRGLAFAIGQV